MSKPIFVYYSYVLNGSTIFDSIVVQNNEAASMSDWLSYLENSVIPVTIAIEFIQISKLVKLY